ncbi:MAG: hypothetical protein WCD21_19565, partial [Streptomyces sp.]
VAVTGTVLASHPGFTSGMEAALRVVGLAVVAAAALVTFGYRPGRTSPPAADRAAAGGEVDELPYEPSRTGGRTR